jgi:hypothetical protein
MSIDDHKTRGMTMLRPTRMAAFGVLVAVVALASSACARTEASEQAAVPTPATSQPSDRQVAQGQPPAPGAPAAVENRPTVYYTQRPEDPEVHLNRAFDLAEFARPRDMSKDPKREPAPSTFSEIAPATTREFRRSSAPPSRSRPRTSRQARLTWHFWAHRSIWGTACGVRRGDPAR